MIKEYIDKTQLFELIYPVGAIYISTSNISPAFLFGGNWKNIEDKFLLSASATYPNGSIGGEVEHTLTINEIPSHSHALKTDIESPNYNITWPEYQEYNEGWIQGPATKTESPPTYTTSQGGSQPHNNMPPYLAVYMWERID